MTSTVCNRLFPSGVVERYSRSFITRASSPCYIKGRVKYHGLLLYPYKQVNLCFTTPTVGAIARMLHNSNDEDRAPGSVLVTKTTSISSNIKQQTHQQDSKNNSDTTSATTNASIETSSQQPPQQSSPTPLLGDERRNALQQLNLNLSPMHAWEEDPTGRNAICKTYYFINFIQAFDFMKHVATHAEVVNHHPEWKNIYNIVEVTLSTHDCHGVSMNDIQMAKKMDEIATSILPSNITEQQDK